MARVFTILNCGTAFDSSNKDVIAELARNKLGGEEGQHWMINPGPGTLGATGRTELGGAAGLLGATPLIQLPQVQAAIFAGNKVGEGLGLAFGFGIEAAVNSTIEKLNDLKPYPEVINVVAWSRGAITSVEIANRLHQDSHFQNCRVNMFLFDPVPGPHRGNNLNWSAIRTQIPDSVWDCSVVLMEDETRIPWRWMLSPLVEPFERYRSKGLPPYKLYPLPGAHWSAVEWNNHDYPQWKPSYLIGRHLCYEFLYTRGTWLKNGWHDPWLIPDLATICNLYALLKLTILLRERKVSSRQRWIPNPERNSLYFINGHNQCVFRSAFPETYRNLGSFIARKDESMMSARARQVLTLLHYYDPAPSPITSVLRW